MTDHNNKSKLRAPWIGAAYYPELWPEDQFESDLKRIKSAGLNAVRMAEFSWGLMEPEEGRFEFEWLHKIVRRLEKEGLGIVLGTPSAAPPAWLNIDHPEVMTLLHSGQRITHGGRYHLCKSSPKARLYVNRIAENMAKEFGSYSNLVSWQVDNELEPFPCTCDICHKTFHQFLEKKYGTLEKLNEKWNTNFWSQKYRSFSDIPIPNPETVRPRHHPSLIFHYKLFQSAMHCEFAHEQVALIKKYSMKPVTHNALFRELSRIDNHELFSKMDFHSVDIYFDADHCWKYAYEYDWMRPASGELPYWLMETASSWNGGVVSINPWIHRENAIYTKTWMSFAMGGDGLFFWPLRMQWAGQETCHGALYYQNGEETPAVKEIQRAASEINQHAEMLTNTVPKNSELAIHLFDQSRMAFEAEPCIVGFDAIEQQYEVYRRLMCQGIRSDLVDPRKNEITDYKAIFTPFCPVFPDDRIGDMLNYVIEGGAWVIGPLSMTRTEDLTVFRNHFYGQLEECADFRVLHHVPSDESVMLRMESGETSPCQHYCDSFEVSGPHKKIAHYTSGALKGQMAIAEIELGAGKLVLLGTWPDEVTLGVIMKKYVSSGDCGPDFIQIRRVDENGHLRALIRMDLKAYDVDISIIDEGMETPTDSL